MRNGGPFVSPANTYGWRHPVGAQPGGEPRIESEIEPRIELRPSGSRRPQPHAVVLLRTQRFEDRKAVHTSSC